MDESKKSIASWAAPTQADIDAWESMTRDEQLEALRALLNSPDAQTMTDVTVREIVDRARAAASMNDLEP
jgi:hypothetical protein